MARKPGKVASTKPKKRTTPKGGRKEPRWKSYTLKAEDGRYEINAQPATITHTRLLAVNSGTYKIEGNAEAIITSVPAGGGAVGASIASAVGTAVGVGSAAGVSGQLPAGTAPQIPPALSVEPETGKLHIVESPPKVEVTAPVGPTVYPSGPTGAIVVHNHVTINIQSAKFRDFDAGVKILLGELRGSNSLPQELQKQLMAEIEAGMIIVKSPKPSRGWIDLLLFNPLIYIADKFASTAIGATATLLISKLRELL